jgi:putative membrane protein
MKTKLVIGLLAFGFMFITACEPGTGEKDPVERAEERTEETSVVQDKAAEVLTETASMNMMNMELSRIAEERAVTEEAKQFAKELSQEHAEVKEELEALAQRKQITLPSEMSDDHKSAIENVTENQGIEFDKQFVDEVKDAHKDKIDEYENLARESEDPEVREFAINTLPTLRMQLEKAERIENQLKEREGRADEGVFEGEDGDAYGKEDNRRRSGESGEEDI